MKMMRMNGLKIACVAALAAMVVVAPAGADDNAGSKLLRGLAGMTLGFLEVPGNMTQIARKDSIPEGLSEGLFKGVLMFASRTLVGTYEVLTFPFPLREYKPILEPTYPWGYFSSEEDKPAAPAQR